MHSATGKERPSSSSCCRTISAGKASFLERNNNNNDILSTAFHSSLKQDATRGVSPRTESKDPVKFDSLPPSGGARSASKNSVSRTGNETRENRQDRCIVSSSLEIKLSGPVTNAETGRRVSSGVEMMSRFAPRPYRPVSADSKVVRTRSQSVEVHSLSGSRSVTNAGLEGQSSPRGRLGVVADDSRVGQAVRNFSPTIDAREGPKTVGTLPSSAYNMSSYKSPVTKPSSSPLPTSGSSTTSTAAARKSKDVPLVNHVMQNASSLPRGSQAKGENLVKSNAKVTTTTATTMMNSSNGERTTAGVSVVSGPRSSDVTSSSAKSGGFTTTSTARQSYSLPPQQTNSHPVSAVSLKSNASLPSKTTNDKKTSASMDSSGKVSSIPPSASTTSSVHSSPAVPGKAPSSGNTTKSNDALVKGHPRDASLVTTESPVKPKPALNDRGSLSPGGSNGSVKHRAVIKSGPESLLFSSSYPGPMASQKLAKDSTVGDNNPIGFSKTVTDGASAKASVALENASVSASRITSSLSSSATSICSENSSSLSKPKKSDATNCSLVPPPSTQVSSSKSSPSSPSTTLLSSISDSTPTSPTPNGCDNPKSSPESPVSPSDSLIIMDSPVALPPDSQRKLNAPTGLRLSTKIDTSNDSVSSALSVLMKRQSVSGNLVPASPKCSYRYGSRGAISSIYQNKLGSGASSQYNKNMSDLYGDFFRNMKDCRSQVKDVNGPALEPSQQEQSSSSKTFPVEEVPGKPLETRPTAKDDSSLPASHSDQTSLNLYLCPTERRSRCNAPQPIRRVLSCDSASTSQVKGRGPILTSETRRLFFEGASEGLLRPDGAQSNGVDRSPSPNVPYDPPLDAQTSFIDDLGSDCASEGGVSSVLTSRENPRRVSKRKQRVSFEPVSLLLNAALEGELDLVKVTIPKVRDAMVSNESGVTALHNSVFSGHHDVCRFLIDYGCTVNITDADGWTPLHCAASCNNVEMVRLLAQNGASLFAMTFSDRQIPVDKCNRQLAGYDECNKYLAEQSQAIGVANGGVVYATSDYNATGTDELSFRETDQLRVIRKGDDTELEWWWAKPVNQPTKQGYVPRSYLSMYPAKPKLTPKN